MRNQKGQFVDGSEGKAHRFKKGQAPWNKGLLGYEPSPGTEFKNGHTPHNLIGEKPRINQHGRDGPFETITTTEKVLRISRGRTYLTRKRINYGRYVYEKKRGKVPDGFVVYHLDGNRINNAIENLVAIPRSELIKLNNQLRK